jgi:uncharacterized protein (DUF1330 family)
LVLALKAELFPAILVFTTGVAARGAVVRPTHIRGRNLMNPKYKMALAVLVGAALGAVAVEGLHAQAKAPIYTVTEIDVNNVDGYMKEYVPVVQPLIKKGGGTLLAASLKVTAMLGTAPKRVAINRWDSLEAAQALYNSPDYKAAEAIGSKYATFRRYAVEGMPQ